MDEDRAAGADKTPVDDRGRTAGPTASAIRRYEETLAGQERVLGTDHPDTLTPRNRLALAYLDAGRISEVIPLYEENLADRERVLGADHPSTLISRSNLALAYQAAGRADEAIPLFEAALADCERVLGAEHPLSRTVRDNLARATAWRPFAGSKRRTTGRRWFRR
jgi:tetratricopeptide (TPR) repeat protein